MGSRTRGGSTPLNRQVSRVEDSRAVVALGSVGVRGRTSELCLENFSRILLVWIWGNRLSNTNRLCSERTAYANAERWERVCELGVCYSDSAQIPPDLLDCGMLHLFPMASVTKHHKASSLKWQKFIVSVLEAMSPKAKCQQALRPLQRRTPRCFSPPVILYVAWLGAASLISASIVTWPPCPCVSLYPFLSSYEDPSHTELRAHPPPEWPHLNITSQKVKN